MSSWTDEDEDGDASALSPTIGVICGKEEKMFLRLA